MTIIHAPTPLISIIVPAYKVEEYLAKCLESIINQTYENLEILVIDDGSPDKSGAIADEFSQKDARVRVIHTANGGVSVARNLGIDTVKGEYVAFVDSDDCLSPDFVEYMLSIAKKTGAYFSMSKNCYISWNEVQIQQDEIESYAPEKAAAELLYPYIEIGCWNKLFQKEFLIRNKIRFPVKFFMGEGLNFIVHAAQLSNCVGVGNRKVYYYRKDNINSATTKLSVLKFINALEAIDNIQKCIPITTHDFSLALRFHRYLTTFYAFDTILRMRAKGSYPVEYKQWMNLIKNDALSMMSARVSVFMKLKILTYSASPYYILSMKHFLGRIKRKIFQ